MGKRLLFSNNVTAGIAVALAQPGSYGALGGISSFTRADPSTCASFVDTNRVVQLALANVLRDSHYVMSSAGLYVRTILLEESRKNITIRSDAINGAGWTKGATTTAVTGQVDPRGGTTGCTVTSTAVGDDAHQAHQSFNGDGTKVIQGCLKVGSSPISDIEIYDLTTLVSRHRIRATWSGGVPTLTTRSGAGTIFPVVALTGGWYLCACAVNSVVAVNNDVFYLYPGSADGSGSTLMDNLQAEDGAFPTSYIPTTAGVAVTRAVDALSLAGVPITGTLFYHYYDLATAAWADAVAAYAANTVITPSVNRAYSHIAVVQGTRTIVQCKAILGGIFP